MISPGNALLDLVAWLAGALGMGLDLPDGLLAGALDERSLHEQLGYGRD